MVDRKLAPPFSQNHSIQLPSPSVEKLANGTEILLFDQVKQSLIKIDIVYKAAKWHESQKGVSHFTSQMLEKGTLSKGSSEIADTFDRFGAHVEISPGFDYTTISLYSLTSKLRDVLPLFIEIIQSPSFPKGELDLMKDIFIQNLKLNNEKNSAVASKLIRKNIFGEHHPYGNAVEESDVASIDQQAMASFFKDHFSPFELYVTGQLSDGTVQYILGELNKLDVHKNQNGNEKNSSIASGPTLEYVEKQESIQTSLRLGMRTINKGHTDYFSLLLLNHILGGYFGSRLMKNIREEKGLSYGIYSSLNSFLHDCFFVIGADVNKVNQEETVREIHHELKQLRTNPIPEQELLIAKNHFLGSIQLDMANPFSVVEKIKNIRLNRLDPNYYGNLVKGVNDTSSLQLMEVADKYLRAEDLFTVKVG